MAEPSEGSGVDLFIPLIAGPFFFVAPPGVEASCVGAGVELDSDWLSCEGTVLSGGKSSIVGAGDEAIEGDSCFGRNLLRVDGGR